MTTPIVQVNYEQMHNLSKRFQIQAEACVALRQCLMRALTPLQQDGWYGQGSQAFFHEMESDILPAVSRLEAALTEGHVALDEITLIFRSAEEEASRLFQVTAEAPYDTTSSPGTPPDTPAITGKPIEDIFNLSYMNSIKGKTWKGEGDAQLRQAMYDLRNNPSPKQVDEALKIIAAKRGMSLAVAKQQYDKFKSLRAQAESAGKESIEELWQVPRWKDYMGSRDHLRFGQIVGDALGLDPVFGAMLNPTGGMVGPNNFALPLNESAPGYHGAFHDAGGFLHTYFNKGPGYDYLGREPLRPKGDSFTGQEAGIRYWTEVMTTDKVVDFIANPTPQARFNLLGEISLDILAIPVSRSLGSWVDIKTTVQNTVSQASDIARQQVAQELGKYQRFVDSFIKR